MTIGIYYAQNYASIIYATLVLTVETGTSPMEIDCQFIVILLFLFCLKNVVLSECLCTT